MKKLKITIKCEGLNVRTNDLDMGLGILDQVAKHGIMNYSFVSNDLLDRASIIIEEAGKRIQMLSLIGKVKNMFGKQGAKTAPSVDSVSEKSGPKTIAPVKKRKERTDRHRFTKAQINTIKANPTTAPKFLKKYSVMKGLTGAQISNKRLHLKKKGLM